MGGNIAYLPTLASPVSRVPSVGSLAISGVAPSVTNSGSGNNNPDSIPAATVTYYSEDYESSGTNAPFAFSGIEEALSFTYEASGGYAGSACWRGTMEFVAAQGSGADQGRCGWDHIKSSISADAGDIYCVSYLIYMSQQYMDDATTGNYEFAKGKIIDVSMWNSGATTADSATRQTIQVLPGAHTSTVQPGVNSSGFYLSHCDGGAGSRFAGDGTNTPFDFAAYPDQWVWVCHLFDARSGSATRGTTTYAKVLGVDSSVRRSLYRDDSLVYNGTGPIVMNSRGWYSSSGASLLWGYWQNASVVADADRYVKIDRVRSANGWLNPPA